MKNVFKGQSYRTAPADVVSVKVESAENIQALKNSGESGQKHKYNKMALKDAVNEAREASTKVEKARDALKSMEAGMVKKYGEHALDVSKMDDIQKLRINPDDYTKLHNARVDVANAELTSLVASDKAVRSVEAIEALAKAKKTLVRVQNDNPLARSLHSKALENAKAMLDNVSPSDVARMKNQLGNAGVLPGKIKMSAQYKKFL